MINYKEQNIELHNKQFELNGWCGKTDVELAEKIFKSMLKYFKNSKKYNENDKELIINHITKIISKHRSY